MTIARFMTPHRIHPESEITRDPIFVLRRRQWVWVKTPNGFEFSDGEFIPVGWDGESDFDPPDGKDYEACVETWHIENVFFTREEGEAWATAREYNYPDGWQVYCVCAEGDLITILKNHTTREEK